MSHDVEKRASGKIRELISVSYLIFRMQFKFKHNLLYKYGFNGIFKETWCEDG